MTFLLCLFPSLQFVESPTKADSSTPSTSEQVLGKRREKEHEEMYHYVWGAATTSFCTTITTILYICTSSSSHLPGSFSPSLVQSLGGLQISGQRTVSQGLPQSPEPSSAENEWGDLVSDARTVQSWRKYRVLQSQSLRVHLVRSRSEWI